jgi:hypothetical protein
MNERMIMLPESDFFQQLREEVRSIIREEIKPQETPANDFLLSRKDAMIFLNCKSTRLWELMKSGKLPYKRNGSRIFFSKEDLQNCYEKF